jgi:hypothetical protein
MRDMQVIGHFSRDTSGSFKHEQKQFGVVKLDVVAAQARYRVGPRVQFGRLADDLVRPANAMTGCLTVKGPSSYSGISEGVEPARSAPQKSTR